MKIAFFYFWILSNTFPTAFSQSYTDCIRLSQDILYAARTSDTTMTFENTLASVSFESLLQQLDQDEKRKAFWLNIYNAWTQIGLTRNSEWYKSRNKFYKKKFINIAGKKMSLDFIEHGILRKSKIKISLGYISKFFPSAIEKKLRVDKLDYRIHFALNCGAKSCPPIAFYKPEKIEKQLDLATNAYLKSELLFDEKSLEVKLPAIFSWFRGDFEGKKGIIRLLKKQKLIPETSNPKIKWKKYDWSLALRNFTVE